jgi:hypothetical protein
VEDYIPQKEEKILLFHTRIQRAWGYREVPNVQGGETFVTRGGKQQAIKPKTFRRHGSVTNHPPITPPIIMKLYHSAISIICLTALFIIGWELMFSDIPNRGTMFWLGVISMKVAEIFLQNIQQLNEND